MKICTCGRRTTRGQTYCNRCQTQIYREADLKPRLEALERYKLIGERGQWPGEFDGWIELQQCHARELSTYLRSRAGTRKVWPDTDHSLSCWLQNQRDARYICTCGAEQVKR